MGFIIGRRRTLRLILKICSHRVTPAALCGEWVGALSMSDDDRSDVREKHKYYVKSFAVGKNNYHYRPLNAPIHAYCHSR